MSLFTLGINHTTAPIGVRERMVFPGEQVERALGGLIGVEGVDEAAILSTCNRTELYCTLHSPDTSNDVMDWLGEFHDFSDDVKPFFYQYLNQSVVAHALRVACGLDSLVLGEPQILGQFKSAYQNAHRAGTLGRQLNRLFQHAFAVAKQIRTDTAIGESPVSVAFAAVSLARQIYNDLDNRTALLIGSGETIELTARHLQSSGIGRIIVANRRAERARELAAQFAGRGVGLPEIRDLLPQADFVIASTASSLPILGKGLVEHALRQRKHRPLFMVDMAIPRDIEPEVGDLRDVYLYTVDDLHEVIQENLESRREAAQQADEMIDAQVEQFMGWLRAQEAVNSIRDYRARATQQRDETLAKARRMQQQGRTNDEVLEYLANTLTNKLIHDPTAALNQAGREGRRDLLSAARQVLKLPGEDEPD